MTDPGAVPARLFFFSSRERERREDARARLIPPPAPRIAETAAEIVLPAPRPWHDRDLDRARAALGNRRRCFASDRAQVELQEQDRISKLVVVAYEDYNLARPPAEQLCVEGAAPRRERARVFRETGPTSVAVARASTRTRSRAPNRRSQRLQGDAARPPGATVGHRAASQAGVAAELSERAGKAAEEAALLKMQQEAQEAMKPTWRASPAPARRRARPSPARRFRARRGAPKPTVEYDRTTLHRMREAFFKKAIMRRRRRDAQRAHEKKASDSFFWGGSRDANRAGRRRVGRVLLVRRAAARAAHGPAGEAGQGRPGLPLAGRRPHGQAAQAHLRGPEPRRRERQPARRRRRALRRARVRALRPPPRRPSW